MAPLLPNDLEYFGGKVICIGTRGSATNKEPMNRRPLC